MISTVGVVPHGLMSRRPIVSGCASVLMDRRPRHVPARPAKHVIQCIKGIHVPGVDGAHGDSRPPARLCVPRTVHCPREVRPNGREIHTVHVQLAGRT